MRVVLVAAALAGLAAPAHAQWTHRYPKVEGFGHHVYLEGYELPTMNAGPTDPAVSPDGRLVAFSARGWIWTFDPVTGRATRVTDGPAMDFRPAWSPDGTQLAFVRDDTRDTWIVVRDLASGAETTINTPAMELDPVFAPDGTLLYASAAEGAFDLWHSAPDGTRGTRLTSRAGIELKPSLSADGTVLVYLHKGGGDRAIARDVASGEERELVTERITSQTRPAVSPDGRHVAFNWPNQDGYELRLLAVADPTTSLRLTRGGRQLPLAPAWSPDGRWIWYTEADASEVMRLFRIRAVGGSIEPVPVRTWDWETPTGRVRIVTRLGDDIAPARLTVTDADGHPAVPSEGYAQFALQHGRIFFYSPGVIEIEIPAGRTVVTATQGITTPEAVREVEVRAGQVVDVTLTLERVWDARAAGYLSADHHFHLNYGGPYGLDPEDLVPMMEGEGLDVATPQLANLHNRFEEQQRWGWRRTARPPLIQFAQEIRPHFLGHLGLLNTADLYWPWIWGPSYQVYGADDRPNAEPLAFARRQGGLGGYVHPVSVREPFAAENAGSLPVLLAVDGILGNMDWLEIACLWTDELGTADLWYRFLNLGVPILPEAGTDVMTDYYRTMAVGTTRLYVQTGDTVSLAAYWRGMRAGRSFVSSGPVPIFTAGGRSPGGVLAAGGRTDWELTLHSAVPVATVEVLVNGRVVWSGEGLDRPGSRTYRGTVTLPAGGWIAARAYGGESVWPAMDSYPFAHTSPVWIGSVGSTDPGARRRAAADLAPLLDVAESRLVEAYGSREAAARILATFQAARRKLTEAAQAR